MSSLSAAGRVVARARLRLAVARAFERGAAGALAGAGVAITAVCIERFLVGHGTSPLWLLGPALGALVGLLDGFARRPPLASAALAVDRAAGTHEAFVSALTADDAAPTFRELSAEHGLRLLAGRSLRHLLPFAVPRRAVPALAAIALVSILTIVGRAPDASGSVPSGAAASVAGGPAGDGAAAGEAARGDAGADPVAAVAPGSSAVPSASGTGIGPHVPAADELPALATEDVATLAKDLADRGVPEAAEALAALRRGDRSKAEELLRKVLTAAAGTGSGQTAGGVGAAASGSARPVPPGAWSAGAWPLRYDREVRAWLRRQAAANGGGDARTEER